MENVVKGYLVVHLYCVIFLGFTADQKDFVAENPTGTKAWRRKRNELQKNRR